MSNSPVSPLENAPAEIKLAVDLICILEDNAIDPKIVLSALDIVRHDFEKTSTTTSIMIINNYKKRLNKSALQSIGIILKIN